MLSRSGYGETVAFSGGVANNPCMVKMLQERLGDTQVLVPEFPDITGAFGAALVADPDHSGRLERASAVGPLRAKIRRTIQHQQRYSP
jgi:activator of 2-hydroxyglutaryl-CoA dehydratase